MSRQHFIQSMFSPRKTTAHLGSVYDMPPTFNQTGSLAAPNVGYDACPTPPRRAHTGPAYNVADQQQQQLPAFGATAAMPATPTSHSGRPMEAHSAQHRQQFQQLYQSPSHHAGDFYGMPAPRTPSTPHRPTSVEYSSPFFQQHGGGGGGGIGTLSAATPTTPGHLGHQLPPSTPTSSRRGPGLLQPCSLYASVAEPPAAHRSSSPAAHRPLTPHRPPGASDENVFNFQTTTAAAASPAACPTRVHTVNFGTPTSRLLDSVPSSPAVSADLPGSYFGRPGGGLSLRVDDRYDVTINNNHIHQKQPQQPLQRQQQQQPQLQQQQQQSQQQQTTFSGYQDANVSIRRYAFFTFGARSKRS